MFGVAARVTTDAPAPSVGGSASSTPVFGSMTRLDARPLLGRAACSSDGRSVRKGGYARLAGDWQHAGPLS